MAQQAPNWKDHLGQIPVNNISAPYAAGTKTMDHLNMDSANMRHSQSIASQEKMHSQGLALDRERLALQQWEAQMRMNLEYMEFEAYKAELERKWAGGGTSNGNNTLIGGYVGGLTPNQAINDFSVADVYGATTRDERINRGQVSQTGTASDDWRNW